jgi:hypothetical protein
MHCKPKNSSYRWSAVADLHTNTCNKIDIHQKTQGHTMKTVQTEALLEELKEKNIPRYCVHGTYRKSVPLIQAGGLNRMARNHVHLSEQGPRCSWGGLTNTKITFWSMITSISSKRLHESKGSVVASIVRTVGVAMQWVRVIVVSE